ncbi:MAG: HDOD domain-containing protein [Pseudomonadota bacterium]
MGWFRRSGADKAEPEQKSVGAPASAHESDTDASLLDDVAPREKPSALADLFLVMEEHLTEIELEDLSNIVAAIPRPPPLVDRLTRGLDDPEELREAVLSSPSLTADVLRVVNSAAFALRAPISSIEHAVNYLGTTMVKGLVVQSAIAQVMSFETDVQQSAYMRMWRSSYVASATAQAFAESLAMEQPTVMATRALLANVGDLALIFARPELSALYALHSTLLTRIEGQQEAIMANSALLSALLAREWQLPEDLYTALRYSVTPLTWHVDTNERSEAEQREDILLYLACRVGDAVAYAGLKEVGEFDVLDEENLDLYLVPDYLRRLELGKLLSLLGDPRKTRRIQQTVSSFS